MFVNLFAILRVLVVLSFSELPIVNHPPFHGQRHLPQLADTSFSE